MTTPTLPHAWRFFRAGGFDQVRLDTAADLEHLHELDQKFWVALACPTQGVEFDAKTLALMDSDKDGRIRAPELIAAARWTCACLSKPDSLLKGASSLPLNAINDSTPEGRQLLASARQILANLGRKDATSISIEDTTDTAKIFAQTQFNGDGIIPAEAAEDPAVRAVITDILACLGSDPDRSGKPGLNQARADQFFKEVQAFTDWWNKAATDKAILPLGEGTAAACATFKTVKAKIDDYFARCRLAAFDARAIQALNREEKEFLAFAAKDLTISSAEIAGLPLARIEASRPLPLRDGLNPAWASAIAAFQAAVVKPLLGDKAQLTAEEWNEISARFAAYDAWFTTKPATAVEKLGPGRLAEILAGPAREAITALIAKDKALEPEANAIAAVDRLLRYHRDLHLLATNFVNFKDFYDRGEPAIFQAGTLYLDARSCELCLRVEDMGRHGLMAGLSGSYLAYCECTRKATGEKMIIAAAFTDGDSDNLMVGRNGIFYDRQKRDWDATIIKIIDNPISIRQAFWAPYKKLARFIQEQINKRAAAADTAANNRLTAAATKVATAAETPVTDAPKPPEPKPKMDTGLIAALGVAAAGLGGMIGGIVSAFLGLGALMPIGVIGIILLISGPSMILAWLKLRKRNLGPLLDANGWAVNAKARINIPFGTSLTSTAKLPPGAQRDLFDPYAESNRGRNRAITAVVILAAVWALWYFGAIHKILPGLPKSAYVVNLEKRAAADLLKAATPSTNAPAAEPAK